MSELKELHVVEDGFINKMLGNPAYVVAFPFLKQYAASAKANGKRCGGCRGRKAANKAIDYTEIKRTLVAMPSDKQAKLLSLVGAKSVRILYRDRAGKLLKITISRRS